MTEDHTWRWVHDGGPHTVAIDLVGGDLLWWSELDPRGDIIDYTFVQAIESFLQGVRPSDVRGLPAEIEAAVRASLLRSAEVLAVRPPKDRLLAAARGGDVASLVALLDGGLLPDSVDVRGRAPLWGAIDNRHDEAARVLVERGAALTVPAAAAPHDLLLHAVAKRLFTAAAALLARGGLAVDEKGMAQHWVVAYRECAPLDLVRALAAKAGRMDAAAIAYATHLAQTRHDDAMRVWLASVNEAR